MKNKALNKIGAMLKVAEQDLDVNQFWKVDSERAKYLIDSQLREVELLQYIYNLIEEHDEK